MTGTGGDSRGVAGVRSRKGLVIVYTGQGKGKTTAAFGIIFRALGRHMRVAVVQFIKGKWMTGERIFAESLVGAPDALLEFHVMGKGFTWESDDLSRDRRAAEEAWAKSSALITAGVHDVVILDELTYVMNYGFVRVEEILGVLRDRPPHVHVVITGRKAPQELIDAADLVTDMTVVKHPFKNGISAQEGIDF